MPRKFKALQIGGSDLEHLFNHSPEVSWDYFDPKLFEFESNYIESIEEIVEENGQFDLVFIQTNLTDHLANLINIVSRPYNTLVDEIYWPSGYEELDLVQKYLIRPIHYNTTDELHDKLLSISFPGQYGDKVSPALTHVFSPKHINVTYFGNKEIQFQGDFGDHFIPILNWQQNLIYDKDKVIEVWPEFHTEGDVTLEYTFRLVSFNPEEGIIETFVMSEEELGEPLYLRRRPYSAYISTSVKAKGNGTIHIGAVHKRLSHIEFGHLLLGSERFVDEKREEFFYYFNPGDFKPPLNVYFSGYREAEGFEAFYLMQQLGAPFLLVSDPRIQGGAFYLGSETYENGIKQVINDTLNQLGFNKSDLILSGLSMGSFGALYYGAQLNPKGINVGKPLVNVGTIAENMKLLRPNDFETSLDIALSSNYQLSDSNEINHIKQLDNKFWNVFSNSHISDTTIAITYMENDDYDQSAFEDLLPIFSQQNVHLMNKAVPGRHNDDTPTVVNWFMNFYHILLKDHFGRDSHAE